ncbi:MAG TPA: beta-ketoacyl synthase N-terminal-like domain-containing protein [Candidatus Limnocylindria bacterium]|nr:beta-ketoacyl synthase N-terminal-like domain-containing protein [Candidatus Limnocylindria bacterium]
MTSSPDQVLVTGLGVVSSIGTSVVQFRQSLERTVSGVRRIPLPWAPEQGAAAAPVAGVETAALIESLAGILPLPRLQIRRLLQANTRSAQLSAACVAEAWTAARLAHVPAESIALIVGGNNLSQDAVAAAWLRHQRSGLATPRHVVTFQDSHQVGSLSELFGTRGPGWTAGAASASGNAALFQGWQLVRSGLAPVCIVVGAAMELSALEWESFQWLGAMAALADGEDPASICRPFDSKHRGFVWGEGAGCLVLESGAHARQRAAIIVGEILGASFLLDANGGPDPTLAGEIRALRSALQSASLTPADIGYINAHGTGAPLGDQTEAEAIRTVFPGLAPMINSTKPLTGHCLTSAGVIEAIATLLQLQHGFAHGNPNLEASVAPALNLVGPVTRPLAAQYAVSNGFGFGGFNGSLVLRGPCDPPRYQAA